MKGLSVQVTITGDLIIDTLIGEGVYGENNAVKAGESQSYVMGRWGVEKVRTRLIELGYDRILVNQDLNPETSTRPDILASKDGKWIQLEVHNYVSTKQVDEQLNYGKTIKKDWLPDIPKAVVLINKRYYVSTAVRELEQNGILLVNGLLDLDLEHLNLLSKKPYT